MTDKELFTTIFNCAFWKSAGADIQYRIITEDSSKTIYLIFQGSTSKTDWLENFLFTSKVYKHQSERFYFHKGILEGYKSANDVIMQELNAVRKQHLDYDLIFSGHSQGGAFSLLAGEDYYFRYGEVSTLITFGAPKILYFKKTLKHFRKAFWNVRQYAQHNDVVPLLVPFPFVYHLNTIKIGEAFNLRKLLTKTAYYHCNYNEAL